MSTCANASRDLDEPLAATAAVARTWLLVEQPGPWGRDALTDSRLPSGLGRALTAAAEGTGVRVALVRRPGPHAAPARPRPARVLAAHTAPGRSWVRALDTADPAGLLGLDLAALGRGEHGGLGAEHRGAPVALVCTNGRRDRCCAVLGRPLAAELAAAGGAEVWEVTHIGGHRFAPTALVLPYGYAYGRLTGPAAKEVLEATREGRVALPWCRGRSAWERPGQAAELAVRARTGEDRAEALTVGPGAPDGGDGRSVVPVRHVDGRAWHVVVERRELPPPRPESCGAPPGAPRAFTAVRVAPARAGARP
ncbi:sucrase ferredoxin [Streptomyces capparidis]